MNFYYHFCQRIFHWLGRSRSTHGLVRSRARGSGMTHALHNQNWICDTNITRFIFQNKKGWNLWSGGCQNVKKLDKMMVLERLITLKLVLPNRGVRMLNERLMTGLFLFVLDQVWQNCCNVLVIGSEPSLEHCMLGYRTDTAWHWQTIFQTGQGIIRKIEEYNNTYYIQVWWWTLWTWGISYIWWT